MLGKIVKLNKGTDLKMHTVILNITRKEEKRTHT